MKQSKSNGTSDGPGPGNFQFIKTVRKEVYHVRP